MTKRLSDCRGHGGSVARQAENAAKNDEATQVDIFKLNHGPHGVVCSPAPSCILFLFSIPRISAKASTKVQNSFL